LYSLQLMQKNDAMSENLKPADIFQTLDRAIASPALGPGSRLPALLRHLVIEELEGRGPGLKAFSIAADVFGRGSEFDPQTDSIVRVEVGRLRKALQLYNATDGAKAPWQIEIPKGAYRPVFVHVAQPGAEVSANPPSSQSPVYSLDLEHGVSGSTPPAARRGTWLKLVAFVLAACAILAAIWGVAQRRAQPVAASTPLVLVKPISFSSDTPGYDFIADGLRADITARLADFRWIAVTQADQAAIATTPLQSGIAQIYAVNLVVQIAAGNMRVRAILTTGARQVIDWSQDYQMKLDADFKSIFELTQDVANRVAIDIGRPLGAISRSEYAKQPFESQSAGLQGKRYLCMLMFLDYWRNLTPEGQAQARSCLEAATASDRNFSDGFAALSFIDLDRLRTGREPARAQELLESAQSRAALALALKPDGALPLMATMTVAACGGDIEMTRRKAVQLAEYFPLWPEVLSDVGTKMALILEDWDGGLGLVRRAAFYNTSPDPWYGLAPAIRLLLDRQPAQALAGLSRASQRAFEQGHLVRLAAAALSANSTEMAVAREDLKRLGYPGKDAVMALLEAECWSSKVKSVLRPALEGAF
jgi:adenylate cyclase